MMFANYWEGKIIRSGRFEINDVPKLIGRNNAIFANKFRINGIGCKYAEKVKKILNFGALRIAWKSSRGCLLANMRVLSGFT